MAEDHPYWLVTLQPGFSTVLSYRLKVEGDPGDIITLSGGSHAGIASNILTLTIETYSVDRAKLQDEAAQKAALSASDDAFVFAAKLYEAATGKTVVIPKPNEMRNACFHVHEAATVYQPGEKTYTGMGKMILPGYFGDRRLWTEENVRVLETRMSDLQPGDILLVKPSYEDPSQDSAWIFDGEQLLTLKDGALAKLGQSELTKLLSFQFFVLLRPPLAG